MQRCKDSCDAQDRTVDWKLVVLRHGETGRTCQRGESYISRERRETHRSLSEWRQEADVISIPDHATWTLFL